MSELSADYAAAGFDGRLDFGKRPALLMVDVCNAYLDPASPLYAGVEDALASNRDARGKRKSMPTAILGKGN